VVVELERPIELVNHYLVLDRATDQLVQVETLVDGRANPEGSRFDAPASVRGGGRGRGRVRQRWGTPGRVEVVEHLAGSRLLPAIVFVFSRRGCDDAARSVVDGGARLTTAAERRRIRAIVDDHVDHLTDDELAILGYGRWLAGLEAGVAAHHAGMVPPFKEAVEACFVEGLVKVVFATETLALGINMPARSVVIESLSKFTGDQHEDLTPSQYTQLTGRAGRRGLDPVGHALVLWSPWSGFDKVAALAASREFVLRSAFQPTYNMVVNLVRRYDQAAAAEMLGRSFAQYQADRALSGLEARRAGRGALLAEAEAAVRCDLGDVDEYRALRAEERRAAREARDRMRREQSDALEQLSPGAVVLLAGRRYAVLSVSHRRHGLQVRLVDVDAHLVTVEEAELRDVPVRVGELELPPAYDPRSRPYQRQVANLLRRSRVDASGDPSLRRGARTPRVEASSDAASVPARSHPVARCPELDRHLAAAADRDRLRRQVDDLDHRIATRGTSLRARFERVLGLLERHGFVEGWALTERGEVLARIFHESDLLVATVVCDGLLDDLDPADLAGVVSAFTYEHRSKEPPPEVRFPSRALAERMREIEGRARSLQRDEESARLPRTRPPDPTFLPLARAWAAGERLGVLLGPEDLSGGDFVRNVRQLIDLLGQVAQVAPSAATARAARRAAEQLHRDLVAVSTDVGDADGPTPTAGGPSSGAT
jgi:ATP-dependent RNA helicase HelY